MRRLVRVRTCCTLARHLHHCRVVAAPSITPPGEQTSSASSSHLSSGEKANTVEEQGDRFLALMRCLPEQRQLHHKASIVLADALSRISLCKASGEVNGDEACENDFVRRCLELSVKGTSSTEVIRGAQKAFIAIPLPTSKAYSVIVHTLLTSRRFDQEANPLGDLPLFYIGQAIKDGKMTEDLWGDAMMAVCTLDVPPQLFDKWVEALFEAFAGDNIALPFRAVHCLLAWTAKSGDIERGMNLFHSSKKKGIKFPDQDDHSTAMPAKEWHELCMLKLQVQLLSLVRRVQYDGGIREIMLRDIKNGVSPRTIAKHAPWAVLNDLMTALSVERSVALVKAAASYRGGDGEVPFFVWAALLRKAARGQLIAEADSLFLFIRKRFQLTSLEKSELLEIMMRMYGTLRKPDFSSVMALYLEHVVATPEGEPKVNATKEQFHMLVRSADSRNAAMMVFLEGCSTGVILETETFEALFAGNPQSSVKALSRMLPYDYGASELDAHLRIPSNADAHLRREEALKYRNKQVVDSTGEVR